MRTSMGLFERLTNYSRAKSLIIRGYLKIWLGTQLVKVGKSLVAYSQREGKNKDQFSLSKGIAGMIIWWLFYWFIIKSFLNPVSVRVCMALMISFDVYALTQKYMSYRGLIGVNVRYISALVLVCVLYMIIFRQYVLNEINPPTLTSKVVVYVLSYVILFVSWPAHVYFTKLGDRFACKIFKEN